MSLASDNLGFSIGRARTGSARLFDLSLTGWSTNLLAISQGGAVYWRVTTGSVLELFKDDSYASGSRIAYGTITSGRATLAADNTSGISGACNVSNPEGTVSSGRLIVSYAGETDLKYVMEKPTDLLDDDDNWIGGGTAFEVPLLQAKIELDQWLAKQLNLKSASTASGQRDLADLATPRQLARTHALLTAAHLEEREASINRDQEYQVSRFRKMANDTWRMLEIEWDYNDDNVVDMRNTMTNIRVTRG